VSIRRLQDSEGLKAVNRLTKNHIDFKNQIMKVKLAVQTLSSSVASALMFGQQIGCIDSSSTDKTAEIISVIDRLFDIFNSKCPVARGYKSQIRPGNLHLVVEVIESCKNFLSGLKDCQEARIVTGRKRMGFVGFLFDA
ncbi:hypothetical protein CAPTEDRAFT_38048, partial [Capitella teleta]